MAQRVTNADLAKQLTELSGLFQTLNERLRVIEVEAKVAKWVLRTIGLAFGSIITWVVTHWKGSSHV